MPPKPAPKSYQEILENLKNFFPAPVSNPVMDSYFVHSVTRFLDRIDDLKSAAPLLGQRREDHYHTSQERVLPETIGSVEEVTKVLVDYCRGLPIWAHPNSQINVVPPTTIPSITAFIAAAIYNPNIISDEFAARFAEVEIETVAMAAGLVGYDPERAGGVFTFGGTGTNFYGCKLGLEKLFGGRSMVDGIREDAKIVCSTVSHYSHFNVSAWLGLGTKNVVTLPATRESEISLPALEDYLRQAFKQGEKVAVILATLGTTDAFGIDDLGAIAALRDELAKEYGLAKPPHIHADSVIGWIWAVFRDYDFETNPLGFHARTLRSLQDSLSRLKGLALADSLGIDFHKTGYAPYISSLFLVKNREDLTLLSRQPELMPYLYHYGSYHPGIYTLECSRSGGGALAAYANLQLLGKEGYRVLIGHVVEMSEMLRERLEQHHFIQVLNEKNYGPVTLFRVYPPGVDAAAAWLRELTDPGYREELAAHNAYNRRLFDLINDRAMRGEGVLLSWTEACQSPDYTATPATPLSAIKSFILSPWTDLAAVNQVANQVLEARTQV